MGRNVAIVGLVLDEDASFYELMTSRWSSVNSQNLATIYDVNIGNNQNLPAARSGFLNRAAMLTKRSGSKASVDAEGEGNTGSVALLVVASGVRPT